MSAEQAGSTQADEKVAALVDPNDFQLTGDGVTISYSTTSFAGTSQLHYKDATRERNFSGDEITSQDSPAGTLVSVTLEPNNDAREIKLTLIIPIIKLRSAEERLKFTTFAIETTDRSQSFVPPPGPAGVLQTYRVHKLQGAARHLVF